MRTIIDFIRFGWRAFTRRSYRLLAEALAPADSWEVCGRKCSTGFKCCRRAGHLGLHVATVSSGEVVCLHDTDGFTGETVGHICGVAISPPAIFAMNEALEDHVDAFAWRVEHDLRRL